MGLKGLDKFKQVLSGYIVAYSIKFNGKVQQAT